MHHPDREPKNPTAPAGIGAQSLRRATTAVARLLAVVGPGQQHIVCVLGLTDVATAHIDVVPLDTGMIIRHAPAETWGLATLLGRAFSDPFGTSGGLVVRTAAARDTAERVRGWRVRDGWLSPLTAAEVFSAYCTDALTGDPLSPERGVEYCPGLPIPTPEQVS